MLDVNQIKSRYLVQMTDADFNQLCAMVSEAQTTRRNCKKATMVVGSLVSFRNRIGETIRGTVIKKMPKNVKVQVGRTQWTVSPQLLTVDVY